MLVLCTGPTHNQNSKVSTILSSLLAILSNSLLACFFSQMDQESKITVI